jgi:zinc/manganese transport system substrate-binding protein
MNKLEKSLLVVSLILSALSSNAAEEGSEFRIVASFSILGDMAQAVVGDLATVIAIVGPNADAHTYQPSVSDARAVAGADVIFINGLGFETWAQTLITESGTDAVISTATAGIEPIVIDGSIDPHAWNSIVNAKVYVGNIGTELSRLLPDHSIAINYNAQKYIESLEELDSSARERIARLPINRRTVVTAHDAFGYLADSYELTFLAPQGIDTEAEPSARDLALLIRQLKQEGAAALFTENITNPALIQQIAKETGIALGGRLYSDALSDPSGPASTYLKMYQHNLETLLYSLEQQSLKPN